MSDRDAAVLDAVADSPRPIEVVGDGAVATRLRASLGLTGSATEEPPGTIIETTGAVDSLRDALARVANLGTIVLAGPCPAIGALDLHDDLHVRGITVVGVEPLSP